MLESENPGFTSPIENIEEALQAKMIDRGLSLACAESCSGGGIARRLVGIAGSSNYFLGGVVSYANSAKRDLLGVKEETLETFGAVSLQVAQQMVEGAIDRFGSDWGVAVTGIAGPAGGSEEKPVGTVVAAVAAKGQKPHIWTMHLRGTREEIIEQTIENALQVLYEKVG